MQAMILSHEGCRAVDPLNSTKILSSSTSNVCSSSPENDPSQEPMLRHDRIRICVQLNVTINVSNILRHVYTDYSNLIVSLVFRQPRFGGKMTRKINLQATKQHVCLQVDCRHLAAFLLYSYKQLCCCKEAARCFVSVSIVSFNTTKRRVIFYCYLCRCRLQIYHCVRLNALFCCLWRNVEASCHEHFVVFSCNQHRHLLPAMCHYLRDGGRGPPATLLTIPRLLQR